MVDVYALAFVFFFNDTATTEIYTLSLHDALPICQGQAGGEPGAQHAADGGQPSDLAELVGDGNRCGVRGDRAGRDRKSTRLNSSHANISYAVFCLKK